MVRTRIVVPWHRARDRLAKRRPERIPDHLDRLRTAMLATCNEWAEGEQTFDMGTNEFKPAAVEKIFQEHTLPEGLRAQVRQRGGRAPTQFVLSDLLRQDRVFEEPEHHSDRRFSIFSAISKSSGSG